VVQIPKDLWTVPLPLEKISDTFKSKICQDLTLKMEDELSLATRQVGAVVLELAKLQWRLRLIHSKSLSLFAKLNDELDYCLQTISAQLELQAEIEHALQQKFDNDCIRSKIWLCQHFCRLLSWGNLLP